MESETNQFDEDNYEIELEELYDMYDEVFEKYHNNNLSIYNENILFYLNRSIFINWISKYI